MKKLFFAVALGSLICFPVVSHSSGALGSLGSGPGGTLTRVEQLWAKYLYQDYEVLEGQLAYNQYARKRTYKQLIEAIAAEKAGTPMPPITSENGQSLPASKFTHGYDIPEVPDDLPPTMPPTGTYSAELEEQGDPEPPGDQPAPPAPVVETTTSDIGEPPTDTGTPPTDTGSGPSDTGEPGESPDGPQQDHGEGDGASEGGDTPETSSNSPDNATVE